MSLRLILGMLPNVQVEHEALGFPQEGVLITDCKNSDLVDIGRKNVPILPGDPQGRPLTSK